MLNKSIMEYLQERLNGAYRRRHSWLAEQTGVQQSTISRIARGVVDPKASNVQALIDFFQKEEAKETRESKRKGAVH